MVNTYHGSRAMLLYQAKRKLNKPHGNIAPVLAGRKGSFYNFCPRFRTEMFENSLSTQYNCKPFTQQSEAI